MKLKKRIGRILLIVLPLLLLCGLILFGISEYRYYVDSRDNQYLLNVSISSAGESGYYSPLPAAYSPGQDRTVSFTVSNNGYIPVQVQEVLLLSVYDRSGNPVILDGSPYTDSSIELYSDDKTLVKALEQHQAVYVCQYPLEAGKPLYEARSEWEPSGNAEYSSDYALIVRQDSPYSDCVLRLDMFLYGKPQAYPHADWQLLTSASNILENTHVPPSLEASFASSLSIPSFSAAQSYHWQIDSGNALLVNVGTIQETNLVIPEKIWLSKTPDGYVEDPVFGTCYDVTVKGDAFHGHQTLQSVTFRDGVSIACNTMWDGKLRGMFENCPALTAVHNLPDSVVSMEEAFQRCSALTAMPQLPAAVENLTNCFYNCSSLEEVTSIPGNVVVAKNCFQNCTSLKEMPAFQEGVADMTGCFLGCKALETAAPLPNSVAEMEKAFTGCTSLVSVPNIPTSVTSLNNCFANCTSLVDVPTLPEGIISMVGTFYGCTQLKEIGRLPDSVRTLQQCFLNCKSLETAPEMPSECIILDQCFSGCEQLSGTVTLSGDSFAYSEYVLTSTNQIFEGCTSLEAILIDGCPNAVDTDIISVDIPVQFTKTHTSGTCEGCQIFSDTFEVNGLTVVMRDVSKLLLPLFMDILEDVPESMTATCNRLIVTPYWNHMPWAVGVYYWDSREAFIRIRPLHPSRRLDPQTFIESFDQILQEEIRDFNSDYRRVIFHELAHGYDRHSSSSILSDTALWKELYGKEGIPFMPPSELYEPFEFRREVFANAVAKYFTDPEALKSIAPDIYNYIDERFGNAA